MLSDVYQGFCVAGQAKALGSLRGEPKYLREAGAFHRVPKQTYRFPLNSKRLPSLRFPLVLLPCLHSSYHIKMAGQDKGTDDHLMPLGDWLMSNFDDFDNDQIF